LFLANWFCSARRGGGRGALRYAGSASPTRRSQQTTGALAIFAHTRARARGAREFRAAAPPIYFWRIGFALLDGAVAAALSGTRGQLRRHGDRNRRQARWPSLRIRARARGARANSAPRRRRFIFGELVLLCSTGRWPRRSQVRGVS